jgi:hypothetical protein
MSGDDDDKVPSRSLLINWGNFVTLADTPGLVLDTLADVHPRQYAKVSKPPHFWSILYVL